MLNQKKKIATGVYFTLVVIVLIFAFILALIVGRYEISLGDFFKMLFGAEGYDIERSIVINLCFFLKTLVLGQLDTGAESLLYRLFI